MLADLKFLINQFILLIIIKVIVESIYLLLNKKFYFKVIFSVFTANLISITTYFLIIEYTKKVLLVYNYHFLLAIIIFISIDGALIALFNKKTLSLKESYAISTLTNITSYIIAGVIIALSITWV